LETLAFRITFVLGMDAAGWTVVGVLSTAVFAAATFGINVLAHLHDRALSGTRGALHVKACAWELGPGENHVFSTPPEWDRKNTRYMALQLLNRGTYPIEAILSEKVVRVRLTRRKVDSIRALDPGETMQTTLAPHVPLVVWVLLHNKRGWKDSGKFNHHLVWLQVNSFDNFHFRRRAWLKNLPK
jgi:hypothetical protein